MTLMNRLQRQLEVHRKNQGRALQASESASRHNQSRSCDTEAREETCVAPLASFSSEDVGGKDNRVSLQSNADATQAVLHQLERLRRLQERNSPNPSRVSGQKLLSDLGGQIQVTEAGSFVYLSQLYEDAGIEQNDAERNQRSVLALVQLLTGREIECDLSQIAFLDTETTGLSGGTGTYAFLVGIGTWNSSGFLVEQFFMRDFDEEAAMICSLEERFSRLEVIVTFNGKCFDLPLLESRFIMHRRHWGRAQAVHLDLLHPCRRLWKLRLKDCSLSNLEARVLGWERDEDVPGHLIPQVYFKYARSGSSTAAMCA